MRHALVALAALAFGQPLAAADRPSVWVTIPPQRWVVERLAGDAVEVAVLVAPGQSHHAYEPTPKQVAGLAAADLFVRLGVSFEQVLLERIAGMTPGLAIVDGSAGITLLPMAPGHHHGDDGHGHGDHDPHYWLDPALLAVHAANAGEALARLLPARAAEVRGNLDALRAGLAAADHRLAALLAPCAGRAMLVYHPAFGYFARRYRLEQVPVEVEGKEPTARQLATLVQQARASGARAVFVQPQFSGRAPQALAEAIGAELVELDPLGESYLANLDTMAARVAVGCGGS